MAAVQPAWGGVLVVTALVLMALKPLRPAAYPVLMTLVSALAAGIVPLGLFRAAAPAYDMHTVGRIIHEAQSGGREVAMLGSYHGQFGFDGRLTTPIVVLGQGQAVKWAGKHRTGYIVVFSGEPFAADSGALYTQPYRGDYLAVFSGAAALRDRKVLLE